MLEIDEFVLLRRLSEIVAKRPYSVIVLDKIEKASPTVTRVLVEVLSKPPTSDLDFTRVLVEVLSKPPTRDLDLSFSIIFMTSSVGSDYLGLFCKCHQRDEEDCRRKFLRAKLIFFDTHDCSGSERALAEAKKYYADLLDSVDKVLAVKSFRNYQAVLRLLLISPKSNKQNYLCNIVFYGLGTTRANPQSAQGRKTYKSKEMRVPRKLEIRKMGCRQLRSGTLAARKINIRSKNRQNCRYSIVPTAPTNIYSWQDHNILIPESELKSMGARLHYTQRGGDVTFHGPHQAILYPIISLREIGLGTRKYVEKLEQTMIELASLYGLKARAGQTGETGVWVGPRKIGGIGVRISSGITSHGLAFNVNPDLNYFRHIMPCGIADKEVTSLQKEVDDMLPSEDVVSEQLVSCFVRNMPLQHHWMSKN